MSKASERPPVEIDVDQPSASRIYDDALGGAHNFAADRAAADYFFSVFPDGRGVAQSNRAFLQRAVRYCLSTGITQFLDLGSGIPTVGNVHEIAQQADPASRVVYVDNEPIAVASTHHLLAGVPNVAIVDADLRDVDTVLSAPETRELLDFTKPIGLMMVAVLHYVEKEDDAAAVVGRYLETLVPGSVLVVSHTTEDPRPEVAEIIRSTFAQTATPVVHRDRDEVAALFTGLELVEPGVVWAPEWRPVDATGPLHDRPSHSDTYVAVGRLTEPYRR
jgi:hypothetical protein